MTPADSSAYLLDIRQRMASASPTPQKAPHLQRSDWIDAGMARLATDGFESVRVELLARDLRVSKGSFYWHFHDREQLLAVMLSRWETDERDRLRSVASQAAASRWAWFVEQNSSSDRVRIEAGVRGWARKDVRVAASVAICDEEKRRFISDVLQDIGFERSASESWSKVVLLVWLGWLAGAANSGSEGQNSSLGDLLSKLLLAASTSSSQSARA